VGTSPSITSYRLLPPQAQIVGLVLCSTLTIVAIGIPHWGARVASVFTGCLAVAFLFFPETQIDCARGAVVEVIRFLGLWTVRQRHWAKEEFAGIKCKCYRKSDGRCSKSAASDDGLRDDWIVELHPHLGRPIFVRQFSTECGSTECPEARTFARQLSELTGLQLIDDNV
jgi:hypothetical protein